MANAFNVNRIITNMALYFLKNELGMASMVYRGHEQEWRNINGHKIGDTVDIDRPVRFKAINGPDITGQIQDVVYGKQSVKLNIQKTVPFKFDARGLTTEADVRRVGGEAIQSAAQEIAEQIELSLTGLYKKVWNFHGIPGTPITSTETVGEVGAFMTDLGVAKNGRQALLAPATRLKLAEQIKTLFMDPKNKSAMEKTKLGPIHNFETYESASLLSHAPGTWGAGAGTALVNAVSSTSLYSTVKDTWYQDIPIDGLPANAPVKSGDVITIAGVFEVNPGTHLSTGRLRNFVVVNDATATAGGVIAALRISPPIIAADAAGITEQAYATVTTGPADNAQISVKSGNATVSAGPFKQQLFFHKNAFTLIMKPLQKMESFTVWETRNHEGLSLTLSKGGDILKHEEIWRLDALFGVEAHDPALAFRGTN